MIYFVVEYKPKKQKEWTLVSNNVKPGGNFVVLDLAPATWYNLKVTCPHPHLYLFIFKICSLHFLLTSCYHTIVCQVTAHNNAGFSIAEYEFATLTATGGKSQSRIL